MQLNFSKLFHRQSKAHSLIDSDPKGEDGLPDHWKTRFYKKYEKMPRLALPKTDARLPVFETIARRKSARTFNKQPLTLEELSQILQYSCGELPPTSEGRVRRAHPSGGGRYPIEAYVLVLTASPTLPAGVYHYNIQDHSLDVLWQRTFYLKDVQGLFLYDWIENASVAIVLTSTFNRSQGKYGERGYRYCLLEAGHIGQNFYLTSEALGVGCCAMGGTHDEALEEFLQIDGVTESVVYSLILGK